MSEQQLTELQEWGRNKSREFMFHCNEDEMSKEYKREYAREYYYIQKQKQAELELAESCFVEEMADMYVS